jgi:hypothetical protein
VVVPNYDELQAQLKGAISRLESLTSFGIGEQSVATEAAPEPIAEALRATLTAFSASLGECRQAVPYSVLHPVIDEEGNFKWCCNHPTEHCR